MLHFRICLWFTSYVWVYGDTAICTPIHSIALMNPTNLTFTILHYFAFIHICCKQFFNCLKFNLVCLCVLFSFNNMLYQECSLGFWEQAYDTPRKLPTDEDQTGCWEQKWWCHIPVVLYSYFLLTCTNICNLSCSTSVLHILVWYLFFSFF